MSDAAPTSKLRRTWLELRGRWWIPTTYFAEGFPYGLVRLMSTAYFKDHGASLQAIGLTSLLGIPWTVKFLWAPFVDTFSTKRRWLLTVEIGIVSGLVLLGIASRTPVPLVAGAAVFMLLAFLAATHDIAIDGYYLEALDQTERARYVGVQSAAYRVALITGGGAIAWACGRFSWLAGYLVAALILFGVWSLNNARLPRIEEQRRPAAEMTRYLAQPTHLIAVLAAALALVGLWAGLQSETVKPVLGPLSNVSAPMWVVIILLVVLSVVAVRAPAIKRRLYASESQYALAFVDYLDRPRIGIVLAFIATFRIGEALLQNMAYPFLKDIGITLAQYGLAHNTFGILATVFGSILGGILIARYGLGRCIWPFVLALNSLNFLYMLLALKYRFILDNPEAGRADFLLVCLLISAEAFGAGFGNAAFTVFIMRTTKASYKAAHFAVGTGLMNVAGTMAGVVSGFLAAAVGFPVYFGLTFLLTLPNMALIPFLPYLDSPSEEDRLRARAGDGSDHPDAAGGEERAQRSGGSARYTSKGGE
jgi:PAT family beta-lactamase induction signal transducer AmpG